MTRYITSDGKTYKTKAKARAHVRRVSDTKGYGLTIRVEDYDRAPKKRNPSKKKSAKKRISAALSTFLKKQNPAFKRARGVRVQKLKGGAIKFKPEF